MTGWPGARRWPGANRRTPVPLAFVACLKQCVIISTASVSALVSFGFESSSKAGEINWIVERGFTRKRGRSKEKKTVAVGFVKPTTTGLG